MLDKMTQENALKNYFPSFWNIKSRIGGFFPFCATLKEYYVPFLFFKNMANFEVVVFVFHKVILYSIILSLLKSHEYIKMCTCSVCPDVSILQLDRCFASAGTFFIYKLLKIYCSCIWRCVYSILYNFSLSTYMYYLHCWVSFLIICMQMHCNNLPT